MIVLTQWIPSSWHGPKYSFVTVLAKESDAHFTRIKRDDGWKHLEELRGQFYGQMYKINPEIISRFPD